MHTSNNWYFERLQDGGVHITLRTPSGNITTGHELTAEEWASVVASMSLRNETGETYQAALAFHMKPTP